MEGVNGAVPTLCEYGAVITFRVKDGYAVNGSVMNGQQIVAAQDGVYTVKVGAEDVNITADMYIVKVTDLSTISDDAIIVGNSFDVICSAENGLGEHQFYIAYKKTTDTEWIVVQQYSANNTLSVTPETTGDYQVVVKARDEKGTVDEKTFALNVADPMRNLSVLSDKVIIKGNSVTVKCSATGGIGDYRYLVGYKKSESEKWSIKQSYSENDEVSITPAASGTYKIKVIVKDSKGNASGKTLTLTVAKKVRNLSTVSDTAVIVGSKVKINGAASGGIGAYTYSVTYKKSDDTVWKILQSAKANSEITFRPKSAGSYKVRITVRDSKNNYAVKSFNITAADKLENLSTISENVIPEGGEVQLSCAASGGIGEYKYSVTYRKPAETKWRVLQLRNSNSTVAFKPLVAAEYTLAVIARDENDHYAKKFFTVTATTTEVIEELR